MPVWTPSCTYCLTGTLVFTRSLVQQLIWKLGASVDINVIQSTGYLVCGKRPGGTKTRAAKRWGISCLDELAFWYAVPPEQRPPLVRAWLANHVTWDEARNAAADIKTLGEMFDVGRLPWKARHNLSAVVDEPDVLPPEPAAAEPVKETVPASGKRPPKLVVDPELFRGNSPAKVVESGQEDDGGPDRLFDL